MSTRSEEYMAPIKTQKTFIEDIKINIDVLVRFAWCMEHIEEIQEATERKTAQKWIGGIN